MLQDNMDFCLVAPTTAPWQGELNDERRDDVEMPEHAISISEDECEALYGMTVPDKIDGRRVYKLLYYDAAPRSERIAALFASLRCWEG